MGAVSFIKFVTATNAREAFEKLTGEAKYEYGHDSYNGTISTCGFGRCRGSFGVYTEDVREKAYSLIEKDGNGEKWVADYIDCGVVHYLTRTTEVVRKEPTSVYRQKFVVLDEMGKIPSPMRRHVFDKKTEAVARAKELALSTGNDYQVAKRPVSLDGSDISATIVVKEQKTKKPMKNAYSVEEHMFCFYGWAAE